MAISDYDVSVVTHVQAAVNDLIVAPRYELEVRGGEPIRVLPDDGFSNSVEDYAVSSELFDELEDALLGGLQISTTFDEVTGRPLSVSQTFESGDVTTVEYRNLRTPDAYPERCSSLGGVPEVETDDLSDEIETTRQEILLAASGCAF